MLMLYMSTIKEDTCNYSKAQYKVESDLKALNPFRIGWDIKYTGQ